MCRILPAFIALVLVTHFSSAEVPTYLDEPSEAFMRTWLLCGPFPNPYADKDVPIPNQRPGFQSDFLVNHGGETGLRVSEGQTEQCGDRSATWFLHTAADFSVRMDEIVSTQDNVFAYAYCEIESPDRRVCTLALGSNDGIRVWLNGEEILDKPLERGMQRDEDLIPIVLRPGQNTLLLKLWESEGRWEFCCRLLAFSAKRHLERGDFFRIHTNSKGDAKLLLGAPKSALKEIIQELELVAIPQSPTGQKVWTRGGPSLPAITIDIPGELYGKYVLQLRAKFLGDVSHSEEILFTAGPHIEHALFADGHTDYAIVIGAEASESERWAARELRHWLREISGADFSCSEDTAPRREREIIVGFNRHTQELLGAEATAPDDMDESFVYRSIGPSVLIWGGKQRGTMYGVMDFLERELGCRWYTPRVTVVPKWHRYQFHHLYRTDSPGLRVRNDFYYEAFDPIWAARNRINGAMNYRVQPGGVECYWRVHTFYSFVHPSKYFEEHPEYYSLLNGKRVHVRAQLCLTNPDVLCLVTEGVRKSMREQSQYLIYSVSQMDCYNPCQCDNCQAIVESEESESGPLVWFINQVAENVEQEFPDKFIGTLAYVYTRKPCKNLRPRQNVVIRLCSIECCFAHEFVTCPENTSFLSDLRGWADIAPHLYIWDYVVNFTHYIMPFPNIRVLQSNLQTYRDNNAIGVMEQAAYQSRGGEFAELRAYVIARLLWNPDCDVEEVINDFCFGYYGRSGQYIREYFDLLHDRVTPDRHVHLDIRPEDVVFGDTFIDEADVIFDRAEAVAPSDAILQRVEMARLPLLYLKCRRQPHDALRDGSYERFCAIAEREGITHYAEAGVPHRELFHTEIEALRE